jgi:hypothetical protein
MTRTRCNETTPAGEEHGSVRDIRTWARRDNRDLKSATTLRTSLLQCGVSDSQLTVEDDQVDSQDGTLQISTHLPTGSGGTVSKSFQHKTIKLWRELERRGHVCSYNVHQLNCFASPFTFESPYCSLWHSARLKPCVPRDSRAKGTKAVSRASM